MGTVGNWQNCVVALIKTSTKGDAMGQLVSLNVASLNSELTAPASSHTREANVQWPHLYCVTSHI